MNLFEETNSQYEDDLFSKKGLENNTGVQNLITLIRDRTGINLSAKKSALVQSRLFKRIRQLKLSSYQEYYNYVLQNQDEVEFFINCLTTNKTEFFREKNQFDYLIQFLNHKYAAGQRQFDTWCAASSTGEEVYTLAITLSEFQKQKTDIQFRILATDIDTQVLKQAQSAIYSSDKIEGVLSPELIKDYFYKGTGSNQGLYKVSENLTDCIKFRRFNLIEDSLPNQIQFDFIFLRNVLIYFDAATISNVTQRVILYLKKKGYLFIGASEALATGTNSLSLIKNSIYKKD